MPQPSLIDLKAAYARNQNITKLLREANGTPTNDLSAILIAYDLQAGSYRKALDDPDHRRKHERYAEAVAAVLAPLQPRSLLEAGTGEATTLRGVLSRLTLPPQAPVFGFDISWSRIHEGRKHCQAGQVPVNLIVAELEAIPLPDCAVDLVFTSHAIEPNHGREAEILRELYRVTGRTLVLFEPDYESASPEGRTRMESLGYCRGLRETAESMGWNVHAPPLPSSISLNPLNPTGLLLIEKQRMEDAPPFQGFACPSCRSPLVQAAGAHFCPSEGLAFPTLRDIPCLARHNAVLASRFLD